MFKLVVLSVAFAAASANPSGLWGGLATPWNAAIAAPLAAPIAAVPLAPVGAYNYRGPLSLAPGQPANILAADGRPLDTLSVNLDRAAHLTAKAVDGRAHWLKKRSIVGAPVVAAAPWAGAAWAAPAVAVAHSGLIASTPVGLVPAAPIAPLGLGLGARLGHLW